MADLNSELDRQSLRGFLARLEKELPDELLRIREPVKTKLEMTSLVFELERLGKSPVVVFENVEGHTMPVVTNVAGNRRVLALALGVTPAELPTAFRERCTRYIPVEPINRPAWHDVTIEGDDIDLTKLPGSAPFRDRRRALHHRRADHRARSRNRRRYDGLPSPHAQGQEPARRLAAFAPAHVGISSPRRGEGAEPAGRHHARHPSAALHGIDGLRLSAARAEIRDHRRAVRRALSRRALRHRRHRGSRPAPRS